MRYIYLLTLLLIHYTTFAQKQATAVIADSHTQEALPYATIRIGNTTQGTLADINGAFTIPIVPRQQLHISYAGYKSLTLSYPFADTILLQRAGNDMSEVVIRPPYDKIKRLINLAIDHKKEHNPEKYEQYACHVYYKMNADLIPSEKYKTDDSSIQNMRRFIENQHILFGETYSKRSYRRAGKLQETILASRLSGFQKTYFTNLVTEMLPFHVYTDNIQLNGINYVHPVANGWQSRYEYNLENELLNEAGDTTFILSYYPKKGANFNSLRGMVFINSRGYAISHITTNSIDSNHERYMKMEQNYRLIDGRWFPAELNYDFVFKKYPSNKVGMRLSGHSVVDSVSFTTTNLEQYSAAYPIKMHDSVDLRSEQQWSAIRKDSLSQKEEVTYEFMDSLSDEVGMDKIMQAVTYASVTGKVPVKFLDIDINRIYTFNQYEKSRLGLGLYTNDRLTRYVSAGGWFGYGFKDKEWKYGASVRLYPLRNKEYWLDAAYYNTYQNTGNVNIHPELDRGYYRSLLLEKVDRVEGYAVTAHARLGYLETEVAYKTQILSSQYNYNYGGTDMRGKDIEVEEVSVNLRYAYKEKRAPIFGHYIPVSTKYPVLYLDVAAGKIGSGFNNNYLKSIAAVTFKKHINRWGTDLIRAEGGLLLTDNSLPLPRSLLLGANGYRAKKNYIYAYGGFVTMYPYTYFNDRYTSLIYRHDFDRMLYKTKYSAPYIGIAHNMLYGTLSPHNTLQNGDIATDIQGYHETGLMINRLVRINYLNIAYLDVNIGGFYHWNGPFDVKANGAFVVGIGAGL